MQTLQKHSILTFKYYWNASFECSRSVQFLNVSKMFLLGYTNIPFDHSSNNIMGMLLLNLNILKPVTFKKKVPLMMYECLVTSLMMRLGCTCVRCVLKSENAP